MPNPLSSAISCTLRLLRWLRRFRKRRGYGIHSPFAFSFVTGVVYEKGEYYAYGRLRDAFRLAPATPLRLKDVLLLFRLANFQGAASCLVFGTHPQSLETQALRAGNTHAAFTFSPCAEKLVEARTLEGDTYGFIYAAEDWERAESCWPAMLADSGMLVLRAIHSSRERSAAWKRLAALPHHYVCFDLHDFGVILHRPKLHRQMYTVNYF